MKYVFGFFGLLGGYVVSTILTNNPYLSGPVGVIAGWIFWSIGERIGRKAIQREAESLSGPKRSVAKALFWWFVLFLIAAAALIMVRLGMS